MALQRQLESLGALLPARYRYSLERKARGRFEAGRLKHADYVFVSFGKSGRTWLRVMISRLYKDVYALPGDNLLGFDNLHNMNSAIPKIMVTHDNYLRDYTGQGAAKTAYRNIPVMLLVRHPGDVTMSQYFQWKHRMRPHKMYLNKYPAPGTELSEYEFMMGDSGLPKAITYMNEWADALADIPRHLLIRYEDMRGNSVSEMKRVAEFLNAPADEKTVQEVVEYAAFENMKKREAEASSENERLQAGNLAEPESFKTRRAKVSGYKDYFDEAQVREIDQYISSHLNPSFGYNGTEER